MKKIVTLACCLIYLFGANAQKHDYNWITGGLPNKPLQKQGGNLLNFNKNPVEVSSFTIPMSYVSCIMSDKNGQLAFYTSGCYFANRNHQSLLNGEKINWLPGEPNYWWKTCLDTNDISSFSTMSAMPGSKEGLYSVFSTVDIYEGFDVKILYHTIDMNLNDGNGLVTEKNKIILEDTIFAGDQMIVRHGNGRDWWYIVPKLTPDTSVLDSFYYFFLVDPSGVQLHHTQQIGQGFSNWAGGGAYIFSPDGTKFVRYSPWNGLFLFDFDRCSGYFSNQRKIFLPHSPSKTPWIESIRDTGFIFGAAAFSPNSKMLYISTGPILYQFDIGQINIDQSRTVIAAYDTIPIYNKMKGNTGFVDMSLAPDGKIYVDIWSYMSNHYHVIEKPDEKGALCQFNFNGLELPNYITSTPHTPNYRLGALKDSPCDTIRVATQELDATAYQLSISPNPTTDRLTIEVTLPHYDEKTELVLCDLTGKELIKTTLPDYAYIGYMDVSQLSAGIYILQLRQRGGVLKSEKVVVER